MRACQWRERAELDPNDVASNTEGSDGWSGVKRNDQSRRQRERTCRARTKRAALTFKHAQDMTSSTIVRPQQSKLRGKRNCRARATFTAAQGIVRPPINVQPALQWVQERARLGALLTLQAKSSMLAKVRLVSSDLCGRHDSWVLGTRGVLNVTRVNRVRW